MRCKCCNRMMKPTEIGKEHPLGGMEDMCTRCIYASTDFLPEREYEHEWLEEGVTSPSKTFD